MADLKTVAGKRFRLRTWRLRKGGWSVRSLLEEAGGAGDSRAVVVGLQAIDRGGLDP